jgi:hypothetical protein
VNGHICIAVLIIYLAMIQQICRCNQIVHSSYRQNEN